MEIEAMSQHGSESGAESVVLTFNLVHEPWICCVELDGRVRAAGLADVLNAAHEIAEITDESPLVLAALHRLLLAILHRNVGPRDTDSWGELWRRGAFPSDVLGQYWTRWESHFNLFDAVNPFYQSASITESDDPRSIGILEFHRASGNNATLVDHTTDEQSPAITPAGAARALVTHQTFALGGAVGYLKSCETDNDKRGSDAPSARGAICLLRGKNLFQTLMLNLAEYDPLAYSNDLPCWERNPSQGKGERTPDGRVDLFTWQSRRSRLFPTQASDGSIHVNRAKVVPGFHVPLLWNPFRDESLQSFVHKRDAKAEERPWFQYRITSERAVWRDSSAIINGIEGARRQTLTFGWIAQLVADGELPDDFTCGLEVLGFATDQQKVRIWRREQLPISAGVLRDPNSRELLRSALRYADKISVALTRATESLAAELLSPPTEQNGSRKPDPKQLKEVARGFGAEIQYWAPLNVAFNEYLQTLGRSQNLRGEEARDRTANDGFDVWRRHVQTSALAAFSRLSLGITQNGRGVRARAIAESALRRNLARVADKLLAGEDNSGKEN
jgi:CRISPR system Cascade subunit CasA